MLCVFISFHLHALEISSTPEPGFGMNAGQSASDGNRKEDFFFQGFVSEGVYSRMDPYSLVVSKKDVCMIEDYDSFMRPVSRTEWQAGEKKSSVIWTYSGEKLYPCVKKEINSIGSEIIVYDSHGRETDVSSFSSDGILLKKVTTGYFDDSSDKVACVLTETFVNENGLESSEKIVFSYSDDSLSSKEIFLNGKRSRTIKYETENDWTETVYYNDEPVFVDKYEDGVRVTGR